ncbi:unnamed protein product [Schistocephalus solidus]|uniref:Protein I'm not dead yet 2 n=1 Tax=Schistocephalus solidus TaxID=70667 RepID=A0A183T6P7_SCHSO|nr:unnamed protein product [Schistocephalus solidus]
MCRFKIPPCLIVLSFYTRYIFIITYPIILLPILISQNGKESKAVYILLLMSGFWVTGCIPLYVTALFPLFLAPIMGLLPSALVSKAYISSSILLFLGGMILATAAENTNLHRRIAVAFMRCMGHDVRMLMLGIMLPTWFLSMWMSNTATTVMMITIVEAFLTKLDEATMAPLGESVLENEKRLKGKCRAHIKRFSAGISLAVCYAASCGGIATLIGSPPNTIFDGLANSRYGDEIPPNFGMWMVYSLPISLLCLLSTWIILCLLFLGPRNFFSCRNKRNHGGSNHLGSKLYDKSVSARREDSMEELERSGDNGQDEEVSLNIAVILGKISKAERQALGHIKFGEVACMVLFVLLIGLWITRKPDVPGWSRFMPTSNSSSGKTVTYVTDTQPTILFAILAFIIPASNPFRLRSDPTETGKFIL